MRTLSLKGAGEPFLDLEPTSSLSLSLCRGAEEASRGARHGGVPVMSVQEEQVSGNVERPASGSANHSWQHPTQLFSPASTLHGEESGTQTHREKYNHHHLL